MVSEASVHQGCRPWLPDHSPPPSCLLPHFLGCSSQQMGQELPTQSHAMPASRPGRLLVVLLHSLRSPRPNSQGCPSDRLPCPGLSFLEPLTGEGEVKRRAQGSTHGSPWEGGNRVNFAGGVGVDGTEAGRNMLGVGHWGRKCEERQLTLGNSADGCEET